MLNTIKRIIRETPRASFANPKVRLDKKEDCIKIFAGSEADACRYIAAIRAKGYKVGLDSIYDGKVVRVPNA